MVFASDKPRARIVGIARPGEDVRFVAPRPKVLFESHADVLAHKLRVAVLVGGSLVAGAVLAQVGLDWLMGGVAACGLLALLFARPGA